MEDQKVDVLLVEDNLHDVVFIMQAVKASGLKLNIHRLKDGEQAWDYLQYYNATNTQPKLILTDLMMPRMNGLDLLAHIKGDEKTKDIPVVVMSSSEMEHEIERSCNLGANSYLIKPMSIELYMEKLINVLNYWLKGDARVNPDQVLSDRFYAI